jgi:hypothetical protein
VHCECARIAAHAAPCVAPHNRCSLQGRPGARCTPQTHNGFTLLTNWLWPWSLFTSPRGVTLKHSALVLPSLSATNHGPCRAALTAAIRPCGAARPSPAAGAKPIPTLIKKRKPVCLGTSGPLRNRGPKPNAAPADTGAPDLSAAPRHRVWLGPRLARAPPRQRRARGRGAPAAEQGRRSGGRGSSSRAPKAQPPRGARRVSAACVVGGQWVDASKWNGQAFPGGRRTRGGACRAGLRVM